MDNNRENSNQSACKYEGLLLSVHGSPAIKSILQTVSNLAVMLSVFVFGLHLATISFIDALLNVAVSGIPFVILTLVRAFINAPRPYELIDFYKDDPPKGKKGKSFPSRHVFSIFLIATLSLTHLPVLASVLLVFGAALAASRVLLGIHFLRDVIAGALSGIASGAIGLLAIYLI